MPRGTPVAIVREMSGHVALALQQPGLRKKMMDNGIEPLVMGPDELERFVRSERRKWGEIIEVAGLRIE